MAKKRIEDFLNAQLINSKKNYRNNLKEFTIDEIIKKEGEENAFKKIYFLEENEIDVTKLESYLKSQFKTLKFDSELKIDSELKRLVRIYDFLKYKN